MKPRTAFSGASLAAVKYGLELACAELHNQIATCPDIVAYAEDIEAAESEQAYFQRLITRIDRKLGVKDEIS